MTVKELKMMLNDMPDDAILLTRNALDASEFEQATAREMTVLLAFAVVLCFRVGLMRAASRRTDHRRRQCCSTERR